MGRKKVHLAAPAKINWSLAVVGKRADGYHELLSLMQTISLYDQVELSLADVDCCHCTPPVACPAAANLAWRAWELIRQEYSLDCHLSIDIAKDIPAGGGLGGGSADAAAVLLGLNKLFKLNLSVGQLAKLAFSLGADIPFFLYGGLTKISGAGEKVLPCAPAPEYPLLIAIPPVGLSTAAVFATYDRLPPGIAVPDLEELLQALQQRNIAKISARMSNMLEPAAIALCPQISMVKKIFSTYGLAPLMSGSGSCVLALSDGDDEREEAAIADLNAQGVCVRRAHTLAQGITSEAEID